MGDIELDRGAMIVKRRGSVVHLGPTDYRLLEFLMRSPGRVFSREQLLNNVWGHDVYIDDRTVDVHIGRLRKALLAGLEHRSHPHRPRRRLLAGVGASGCVGVRPCGSDPLRRRRSHGVRPAGSDPAACHRALHVRLIQRLCKQAGCRGARRG